MDIQVAKATPVNLIAVNVSFFANVRLRSESATEVLRCREVTREISFGDK